MPWQIRRIRVLLALGVVCAAGGVWPNEEVSVPSIAGEYVNIYQPAGDVFPGPDAADLKAGEYYAEWVANDHCFVKDDNGRWHAFGITHPFAGLDKVHAGEAQSFHALAPKGALRDVLRESSWKDQSKVLPPAERPGELIANHAPYIVQRAGLYHMFYGPTPIRCATSEDLYGWTPVGNVNGAPSGRDPSLLHWNNTYYLLVCGNDDVRMALSEDLAHWEEQPPILVMPPGIAAESPTLIRYNGTFYLFVCLWDGQWDRKELVGAYQHITCVYQSDDPFHFEASDEVTRLNAHAPEIFQDEAGSWFISSVEWPRRGVSIAPLTWK